VLAWAAAVAAQEPARVAERAVAVPLGALAPRGAQGDAASAEDPGVAVDMFENPNLDRYLHKAQSSLDREDYRMVIELLQEVIEGRTSEVLAGADETSGGTAAPGAASSSPAAPSTAPAPQPATPQSVPLPAGGRPAVARPGGAAAEPRQPELDARNSVFSHDGRIYRPVRRLCHEMLARLPAVGLEIYRAKFEVAAEEMLQQALAEGSLVALEQVANRYFVTLPAGRAMALLVDRLMHEGRYRGAVLVLRDLLEVYPAAHRQRLGIDEVWCRFKVALCLRLAGEVETAHEAVQALAAQHPLESLRVQGELHAVKDLPADALFARDVAAVAAPLAPGGVQTWLPDTQLVGLWQFRFRNPNPYRDPKTTNENTRTMMFDGQGSAAVMPHASRYGPATWVRFTAASPDGLPEALFFEHFRLRDVDATSGVLRAQTDAADEPPVARDQQPRVRVAAHDYALLRPVDDGERRYAVLGPRTTTGNDVLKASELVAYDPVTLKAAWSSKQWEDGDGGMRDVTFLAAPTVFGERLLLPSLRRGKYSLECVERTTGRPMWNAQLHGGGSPFFKAPGCPVVVQGGIAFVATNAGCVASVDAFTGDVRWIRRYERADPLRKTPRPKRSSRNDGMVVGWPGQFRQEELLGFLPNDLVVVQGLVFVAPCDGDVLLCLDGATGQPQWLLDAGSRYLTQGYGRLRGIVGVVGDDLFAWSDTHLVAVGVTGGLLKWARELPSSTGVKPGGRGRGTVADGRILMPGEREIVAYATDGSIVARLPLPAFDASREPLAGSCNLVAHGPWLAVGFAGGVEVYSTAPALRELAARVGDARRRAELLVRAGARDEAITLLRDAVGHAKEPRRARALANDLVALVRERAFDVAAQRDTGAGLAELDAIGTLVRDDHELRLAWHLARIELCKERGDLRGHEQEQNRLYAFMEGKG
jgi:hypothetical protein